MRLEDVAGAVFCFNVKSILNFILVDLDQLVVFVLVRELAVVVGVELERNIFCHFLVSVFSA
jgi:hypothetical protein